MDSSYKRYRQYQVNRHRYKNEQIAAPIAMMLIIGFITEYWWIIVTLAIVFLVLKCNKICIKKKCPKEEQSIDVQDRVIESKQNKSFQEEEIKAMSTTEIGYVNKNNQRNNGKTNIPGTGYGQWFYDMECLKCGHKYHANGHDIWLRKCPKCQGGRP